MALTQASVSDPLSTLVDAIEEHTQHQLALVESVRTLRAFLSPAFTSDDASQMFSPHRAPPLPQPSFEAPPPPPPPVQAPPLPQPSFEAPPPPPPPPVQAPPLPQPSFEAPPPPPPPPVQAPPLPQPSFEAPPPPPPPPVQAPPLPQPSFEAPPPPPPPPVQAPPLPQPIPQPSFEAPPPESASVGSPSETPPSHLLRALKRDYDYFTELDEKLAQLGEGLSTSEVEGDDRWPEASSN